MEDRREKIIKKERKKERKKLNLESLKGRKRDKGKEERRKENYTQSEKLFYSRFFN